MEKIISKEEIEKEKISCYKLEADELHKTQLYYLSYWFHNNTKCGRK